MTHRNVVSNAASGRENIAGEEASSQEREVQLAVLPLAHAYGLVATNVGYLSGAKAIFHPRFDTTAVVSGIERHLLHVFAGVPALVVALLFTACADKHYNDRR